MECLSEPVNLNPLPLLIILPCLFLCWASCWQVRLGQINSVPFFLCLVFSQQLVLWLIVYVLPLHLNTTLPSDTNDCPRDACAKALSSYLHLIPEPNESGDWVPPCEPRLRVITMLEQSQAKLIMWVQWYFYWITFSRHRQRASNPPRPTFFLPQLTIFSKRMLGSSRHKSEWHWECSTDNERGHAAPLREERHCLGSLLSSGINLYGKLFCVPPSAIVAVRQWVGRKWRREYVSFPVGVKVITLLNRNKRIFIGWSSRLVSDLSD